MLEKTLFALAVASTTPRLELLLHASQHGHVAPGDAHLYASLSPRSGTGQYHVERLVAAGLLQRTGHGRYALTRAGRLIARLHDALAYGSEQAQVIEIRLSSASPVLDAALSTAGELYVDLVRSLPRAVGEFRLVRDEAG